MSDVIRKYFPEFSEEKINQFRLAEEAYRDWNEKINVISRKDIDQLYVHHFLHSLSILKFKQFSAGTKFIDAGTGGGFPGVPLAIALPDCKFTLVDSVGKKLNVINEVCTKAVINNIQTVHSRVEEFKGQADFVTGRAVETLSSFYNHTKHLVQKQQKERGILYLKGGDLVTELNDLKRSASTFDIYDQIMEPYFETKKLIFIPV